MTLPTLPRHGETIVFSVPPRGSYAAAGIAYRVTVLRRGADIHLNRADNPMLGTFDRPSAYAAAAWQVIGESA